MPRLRVLAGPSPDELVQISVNADEALHIKNDAFEGQVAVYINGLAGPSGQAGGSTYFERRSDVTWSIQVQGRFLRPYSADDVLFGNTFERPLKLPWGFSAALKFMRYVDPTLEQDLASQSRPWALSPLIATMPYMEHRRAPAGSAGEREPASPAFPAAGLVGNDLSELPLSNGAAPSEISSTRRSYFRDAAHRKAVVFGPEDLIRADFCYNYLRFSPEGVDLRLPGGISIDMMKYWGGQPVRFVCCERAHGEEGNAGDRDPWGRVFWCVVIEPVNEDEEADQDGEGVD